MREQVWRAREWADHRLIERVTPARGDVAASVALAAELSELAKLRGHRTWDYLCALASLGAVDLTTARVVEPHLDALAILAEHAAEHPTIPAITGAAEHAADDVPVWGVYAANAPDRRLRATRDAERWRLHGTKPWCSLPSILDRALVTADAEGQQRLFAVDLSAPGVAANPSTWVARGLADLTTTSLRMDAVTAEPVGGPEWYLTRRGFAHGGVGVAAVWFGATAAIAHRLLRQAASRPPDQVLLWAIGRCDQLLDGALLALRHAAEVFDDPRPGIDENLVAARVRAGVAEAAEEIVRVVGRATGPAPLVHEEEHARRVADLAVYVRQYHAERDLARLGGLLVAEQGT